MSYDPERHHRRSIRLKGYDYAQAGAYFVTVCAQGRQCLYGDITDDIMHFNDAGRMVERWWLELNHKFPTVETDEYSVMPNHFHGIIVITADDVGAALCGRPGSR
jgi:REP element-mobilizing transposase RayT